MKKIAVIMMILSTLLCFGKVSYAQREIAVTVDGTELEFDVAPMLYSDRVLVPMRSVFEALGAEVIWDGEEKVIEAVKDEDIIYLYTDKNEMLINSVKTQTDVGTLIVDGRALVPLRAVSEALGCRVEWDGANRAVAIQSPDNSEQTIEVSTIDELLNAVGNNKTIVLTAPVYNFSDASECNNPFVTSRENIGYVPGTEWAEEEAYTQWTIRNVKNLTITGDAEILVNSAYADVLYFSACKGVTLNGLTVGHTAGLDEYECEGNVTQFDYCENVSLNACKLFGCGAVGVNANNTHGLTAYNCRIYDCTFAGVWISYSDNILFDDCEIFDCNFDCNTFYGALRIDSSDVVFKACNIHDISTGGFIQMFSSVNEPAEIVFESCTLTDNNFEFIANNSIDKVRFNDCVFEANTGAVGEDTYNVTYENCTIK